MAEYRVYGYTMAGVGITDPYFAELMRTDHFERDRRKRPVVNAEKKKPERRAPPKLRGAYARGLYLRKKPAPDEAAAMVQAKFRVPRRPVKPPRSHPWAAFAVVDRKTAA